MEFLVISLLIIVGVLYTLYLVHDCQDEAMFGLNIFSIIFVWVFIILFSLEFVTLYRKNTEEENNIESALNRNYTGYTNYHNGNAHTFVCDGKKYSFEYDYDTNTLTVFNETGTIIDGTYIDGQKQDNNKEVVDVYKISSETAPESKVPDTSIVTNESDSTAVSEDNSDLNRQIQSAILERYTNALITNYDTNTLSGTFESGGISYTFSWSDNLLEVTEVENSDNVVYVKIAE